MQDDDIFMEFYLFVSSLLCEMRLVDENRLDGKWSRLLETPVVSLSKRKKKEIAAFDINAGLTIYDHTKCGWDEKTSGELQVHSVNVLFFIFLFYKLFCKNGKKKEGKKMFPRCVICNFYTHLITRLIFSFLNDVNRFIQRMPLTGTAKQSQAKK